LGIEACFRSGIRNTSIVPARSRWLRPWNRRWPKKKHLIVEAGTGTGKTLAYLVPAILSGRRVVISTGTKNLQEQLFFKDIPFLEKHLVRCGRAT